MSIASLLRARAHSLLLPPSRKLSAQAAALIIPALACLLAPQMANATPQATTTTLSVTNSHGIKVTQVVYNALPPANTITLAATVRLTLPPGGVIPHGNVVFCEVAVANCLDGHAVGIAPIVIPMNPGQIVASINITPAWGTHTYRAVFQGNGVGIGASLASSTSAPVTIKVVGPPPPGVTQTVLTDTGSVGNYNLKAQVTGIAAGDGWGPGFDIPLTGTVNFFDTTNSNFSLGTPAIGATTFTSGFLGPVKPASIVPAPYFYWLGAAANTKTAISNQPPGTIINDGSPDLILLVPNLSSATIPPGYQLLTVQNQLLAGAPSFTHLPILSNLPNGFPSYANPLAMVTGDFNNDGNTDLIVSFDDNSLLMFGGTGVGVFFPLSVNNTSNFMLGALAVGDLANTGNQSFVGYGPFGISVYANTGFPSYAFASPQVVSYPGFDWGAGIAMGNFNDLDDGYADVVVTNPDTNNITIFPGINTGIASTPLPTSINVGSTPAGVVVGDFNGDGHLDIAVANSGDNSVTVLLGDGHFNFTAKPKIKVGDTPLFITTGDFNGDGITDLAVGNSGDGSISVLLGKGNGAFTASPESPIVLDPSLAPLDGVLAADFNSDNFTDIAAVNFGLPDLYLSTLTANASATLNGVAVAGSGPHNVRSAYSGDTNYQPSTSNPVTLTAAKLPTALHLTAQPNPSTWGQQVALTATLSPFSAQNHTTNGEFVTFKDGATSLGTAPLVSGVATKNITTFAVGTHSLTAVYGGDSDFAGSTATAVNLTVNKAASSTVLSAGSLSPQVGIVDLLTVTVTGFSSPGGEVDFKSGANTICSVILGNNGKATCPWVPWLAGPVALVATYAGDTNHTGSTSNTLHLTVASNFNQNVVLSFDQTQLQYPGETNTRACITHGGNLVPTGTITIYDDLNPIETMAVGGDSCIHWWITPGLLAGTHHMRAYYSGDHHYTGGFSPVVLLIVSPVQTYWSVQCGNQSFKHGGNYTCSISIWSNAGPGPGHITFSLDNGSQQSVPLSGGAASFQIVDPSIGYHNVVIAYPGTSNYAALPAVTENFTVTH